MGVKGCLLEKAAPLIDKALADCPWQTLVHGDAKLANFCFSERRDAVAAVDFQYVGGGCGMKDVAYFVSSCLDESECEALEDTLLDYYFSALAEALSHYGKSVDFSALEQSCRGMYPVAWTDFFRFLQGWSPGHWKIHAYSQRMAERTLSTLDI